MSAERPEISIIVPAYNVQAYLKDCLDSILRQSFSDWELIICDDGSTDDTAKISDEYAATDKRIKVIHTDNTGVSAARNICLDTARGDYISFVDADDSLDCNCLRELISHARSEDADITQCSFSFVTGDGVKTADPYASDSVFKNRDRIMNAYFNGPVGDIRVSVWAKLFKRSLISDVRFDTGLRVFEDAYYVYQCCMKAGVVCSFSEPLYNYRQHKGSTMDSRLPEIYSDYFTVFGKQKEDLRTEKKILKKVCRREAENALWLMGIMIRDGKERELWNIRKAVLDSAGRVVFSSTPIKLRFKLTCMVVIPHIYFSVLTRRKS